MRWTSLISALVGCGPVCTDDEQATRAPVAPPAVEITAPPRATEAVAAAVDFYNHELGILVAPTVHWTAERIPYGDTTVIGLTYGCDVWITWWPAVGTNFDRIALAHEIGHCVRAAAEGDSDHAHADAAWWNRPDGITIRAADNMRAMGL